LRVRLQKLEAEGYVDARFDNRYVLTGKGKAALRRLREATAS